MRKLRECDEVLLLRRSDMVSAAREIESEREFTLVFCHAVPDPNLSAVKRGRTSASSPTAAASPIIHSSSTRLRTPANALR